MNWTDIFPVMHNEFLLQYDRECKPEEKATMEEWLGVERIFHGRFSAKLPQNKAPFQRLLEDKQTLSKKRHVVSTTLFWKSVMSSDPNLPKPTRKRIVTAKRLGLVKRFAPWSAYVEPLLDYTREAIEKHPDVEFRIYLAKDLDFLITDLTDLGWEVHLMKSSSIRYCPGGLWRFLALGEKGCIVTVIDTDRISEADGDISRTMLMEEMNLSLWRVPGYHSIDNDFASDTLRYRPILGGHFGAKGGLPMRKLLESFIWHSRRSNFPVTVNIPGRGATPVHRTEWPSYGFDEWFLLAALYPRLITGGTLSFLPFDAASKLLPIDIEYVTWANRRSEIVHF